jgi:nicotinate-nucleotide pyrophosphorylase (carboxylating)
MREPWNDLPLPDLHEHLVRTGLVRRLLELARDEDLGPEGRDLTAAGEPDTPAIAAVVGRAPGVGAGLATLPELLDTFNARIELDLHTPDGARVNRGDTAATLRGPLPDILRVERTLLNLVGRLSGVATRTALFAQAMGDAHARLYDTRKTTPGLRVLEKYAVRCGGGFCHRLGLHDAAMFKDNHIAGIPPEKLGPRLAEMIAPVRAHNPAFVEVEVDTLDQFDALLAMPTGLVDIVLLDNMDAPTLAEAAARRDRARSPLLLEASGGVSLQTIAAIARTGVDRVSVGSLTHQAVSLDFGLDIVVA